MTAAAIVQALNAIQALIGWITQRGVSRSRVQKMLDDAAATGEDISTETVQAELDATAAELDETEGLIDGIDT